MKNRTSLFVLAVEILAIVVLHTMRASANDPSNISAKEVPPVKAEIVLNYSNQSNNATQSKSNAPANTSFFSKYFLYSLVD